MEDLLTGSARRQFLRDHRLESDRIKQMERNNGTLQQYERWKVWLTLVRYTMSLMEWPLHWCDEQENTEEGYTTGETDTSGASTASEDD